MSLANKILLFFVILGAINIIILLIIRSKSQLVKREEKSKNKCSDIKILNYDDEDLICKVDNDLQWQYGYGCTDENVLNKMKKTHRNIYTLLWFETEMNSGGLGEYLFDYSNITMTYIEEALQDIEAYDLLENYKKAMEENNILEGISRINKRNVEEYSLFMSEFDFSIFDKSYSQSSLRKLMANYIRENIVDFSDLSEEELRILKEMEIENYE
ncbi:DMP19 family protein [Terrisporobacter sp.]